MVCHFLLQWTTVCQKKQKILRRGGKNTEELYKKDLYNLDIHDGVIMHLEPDILECEVKWPLES